MKNINGYYLNYISSDISTVISLLSKAGELSRAVALVTTIDSTFEVSKSPLVQKICKQNPCHAKVSDNYILVSADFLVDIQVKYNLFNGFDELCFFPLNHRIIYPKLPISIVTPYTIFDCNIGDITTWMKSSGCVLFIGDGVGLNYITVYKYVAELIDGCQ